MILHVLWQVKATIFTVKLPAEAQSGEHGATALHVATARGDRNEARQNAIAQTWTKGLSTGMRPRQDYYPI